MSCQEQGTGTVTQETTSEGPSKVGDRRRALRELTALFLRLGATAFGGPAVHIAIMEDEVVGRRRWLTREQFLDLMGATNLIPGPNSTEMAIHIGNRQAGFPGLLVAGSCFILPAVLIVSAIAWTYVRFGTLPQVAGVLYGIKPVVIAVVLQALWRLGRSALKGPLLVAVCVGAVTLSLAGVNELVVLLAAGLFVVAARSFAPRTPAQPESSGAPSAPPAPPAGERPACSAGHPGLSALLLGGGPAVAAAPAAVAAAAPAAAAAAASFGLWPLFLFFLKVGAVLFGSGYVLLAFLRADLVERWHWLTESQLLDAVAVGQVTPGPLFTTATFIGYVLAGPWGALVATVGIFLPAFFFVAVSGPLVPRLRQSWVAGAMLDGVNVASLALMAVVTVILARAAVHDGPTVALAVVSAFLLLRYRVNSTWLVAGGALAGLIMSVMGR
jgi:chromate transporter